MHVIPVILRCSLCVCFWFIILVRISIVFYDFSKQLSLQSMLTWMRIQKYWSRSQITGSSKSDKEQTLYELKATNKVGRWNNGLMSFWDFIKSIKCAYYLCGHIHNLWVIVSSTYSLGRTTLHVETNKDGRKIWRLTIDRSSRSHSLHIKFKPLLVHYNLRKKTPKIFLSTFVSDLNLDSGLFLCSQLFRSSFKSLRIQHENQTASLLNTLFLYYKNI